MNVNTNAKRTNTTNTARYNWINQPIRIDSQEKTPLAKHTIIKPEQTPLESLALQSVRATTKFLYNLTGARKMLELKNATYHINSINNVASDLIQESYIAI